MSYSRTFPSVTVGGPLAEARVQELLEAVPFAELFLWLFLLLKMF